METRLTDHLGLSAFELRASIPAELVEPRGIEQIGNNHWKTKGFLVDPCCPWGTSL